ncbi:hypothetical protein BDW66DRAFT_79394 [Aspergillus desertorum]
MRPKSRNDIAIAVICALPLEADAVVALFDEQYDRLGKYYGKQRGDENLYINGRIGKHDVVLCLMPRMGKQCAADVASSLKVSYTGIELALVVGICGGAPPPPKYQEIFLGDVIISDSVIEYDFGRQYPGGFQRKTGVKDTLDRLGREIRTLLNGLHAENARCELQNQTQQYLHILQQRSAKWCHPGVSDILFKPSYLHKHYSHASPAGCSCLGSDSSDQICEEALGNDCDNLNCDKGQQIRCREISEGNPTSIYIGPVASDTIIESGQHRDEIVRKENVIGFEMEGAGVWDNVPCIIIKGVSNYADGHKSKSWQTYAAATGASAAKAFLEFLGPLNHKGAIRTTHLMIPFSRNPRFVGRQEIHSLEGLISIPGGPRIFAITGLGGIGKTQIALELAYRMRDSDPECSIFWIPCTSYEAVDHSFMTIAQMVGLQNINPAEVRERVKAYLAQKDENWLLVFDNADDMDMWTKGTSTGPPLKDFIPYSSQGHIIFTTRSRKLALKLASSNVIHVRELDEKTGVELLEKSLISKSQLTDRRAVISLLDQLTFLPLAITQAAAFINQTGIGVSDYLLLLQEQEAGVVELLSEEFWDDGRRYNDMQNPVAITWLISFRQVQKLDRLASDYLSLMACVNPRNIPESFLPRPASKKKIIDALGLLTAYSFITIQPGDGSITLHRLVHLATRNWIKKEGQFSLYMIKAADRLSEIFPHNNPINRQLWRKYLPHALSLLSENEFQKQNERYIDFIWRVATCLDSDGRFNEAENLFVWVMATRKQVLGLEHPDTLASMDDLASTYWSQGRWKEAEELQIRVTVTRKQVLGPEHPSTLTSMMSLAATYKDQGRWKEAEELLVQVMDTQKQVLGPEHPDTLTSMANLASTYWNQGRWNEAGKLEMQVMEVRGLILGPEHPFTLTSMANLASTYWSEGKWKEAEELQVQVIESMKRVLGPEHPSTLTSMMSLAATYKDQGRWKEAEELLAQVMDTQKRVLGPEHPDTLTSMHNLASTYANQGLWKEAEELQMQVAETRKQVLGPEHPSTLTSMHNLALTYADQGRWTEAEELLVQVMETRKQVLGQDHLDTLESMSSLASTVQRQGEVDAAERLLEHVVDAQERALGPEHPITLASMDKLASILMSQGRIDEAETMLILVSQGRKLDESQTQSQTQSPPAKAASVSENQESSTRPAESVFAGTTLVETQAELQYEAQSALPFDQKVSDTSEDEDYISVVSNDDDIASQVATKRTEPEIFAARYFGSFLAELKELRPLHEEALRKLGVKRFRENYRRILKYYVVKLRPEAYSAIEKDIVRVLKSRLNRMNIAERILSLIQEEKENKTKPLDELISRPVEKQSLEAWARNAYGQPAADVMFDPEIEGYEQSDDEDEIEDAEEDAHLQELQFPNLTYVDSFLRRDLPFQALVLNLRLLLLPATLREMLETTPKRSIHISQTDDTSLLNHAKELIENYTGFDWDWWPLMPRIPKLSRGRLRLQWEFYGETLYGELSPEDADSIRQILEIMGNHPPKCFCCEREAHSVKWTTAVFNRIWQYTLSILNWKVQSHASAGTAPSVAHQRYTPGNAPALAASPVTIPNLIVTSSPNSPGPGNSNNLVPGGGSSNTCTTLQGNPNWVVFGIKNKDDFDEIENIEIFSNSNDTIFFRELKRSYAKHRCRFQRWLSPFQFRHCKFVQRRSITRRAWLFHLLRVQPQTAESEKSTDQERSLFHTTQSM